MVRLGRTKRSPSVKSSNQRCSGTMRWLAGSNSVMAVFQKRLCGWAYRYRSAAVAAIDYRQFVMPGLVPGIHVFKPARRQRRGWPVHHEDHEEMPRPQMTRLAKISPAAD